MQNGTASVSKKRDVVALLAALSLFLSLLEYSIPKPIPFMKIGLANLPLLIGLRLLPVPWFFLLTLLKIITQGLVSGSLISYTILFSFCGSLASALGMLGLNLLFKDKISLIGISLIGALASNLVQILLARYLVFGPAVWVLAPPFLLAGIVAALILGSFANRFYKKSRWVKLFLMENSETGEKYESTTLSNP